MYGYFIVVQCKQSLQILKRVANSDRRVARSEFARRDYISKIDDELIMGARVPWAMEQDKLIP